MRDVSDVATHLEKLLPERDEYHVSVLPTSNLITWLHDRSGFVGTKIKE